MMMLRSYQGANAFLVLVIVLVLTTSWNSVVVHASGVGWIHRLNRIVGAISTATKENTRNEDTTTASSCSSNTHLPPHGGGEGGEEGGAGSRVLAKDEQETSSMNVADCLGSIIADDDRDEPLMADLDLLSKVLSDIVDREDTDTHYLYEHFRQLGLQRARDVDNSQQPLDQMIASAEILSAKQALGVVRTFSIMLNLVNSAEVNHRFRNLRKHAAANPDISTESEDPLPNIEDSVRGTIYALLGSDAASPHQIYQQLLKQKVEIVLTAHPTQVQRKSLLRLYRQVPENLALLERSDLDGFGKAEAKRTLKRLISSIWGADEIRRTKPTPQQEAAGGSAIVESVLWEAVPDYLRKLNEECRLLLGRTLPIDLSPIHFASWIGGDRDGNPNVTPEVTKEVVLHQRLRAARLLIRDLYNLRADLAISSSFSPQMEELAASVPDSPHKTEKYRRVVGYLIQRLIKTARQYEDEISKLSTTTESEITQTALVDGEMMADDWQSVEPIYDVKELMEPLKIVHDSLVQTGFELVADGSLVDIIRRLAVFGLSFLRLDIREESTRHTLALDAITKYLGIGSYQEWSEEARLSWLVSELSNKRPLLSTDSIHNNGFDPDVVTTLRTFETASKLHPADLGAYVISQAQTASDVLAVMLLQKEFGMTPAKRNMMRVVPLFETLDDLTNAPDVLRTLFSTPLSM